MKILALAFLLFGIAAATPIKDLERAKDEVILSFLKGMEEAPSLRESMNVDWQELDEVDNEIKSELVKKLKEQLNELIEKVKDAIEHGRNVKDDLWEHILKLKEHLKDLHEDISTKAKQIFERLKEKVKGKFREIMERITGSGSADSEAYEIAYSEGGFKDKLFEKLRKIKEKLEDSIPDPKKLAEYIREQLKGTMLAEILAKKALKGGADSIQKMKDIIDGILNKKESRSVKDLYEKIKDYLKEAREDFEKHYSSFLGWLEKVYKSGVEAAKGRVENLRKVLLKFLKHVKEVGKKTADEALEFFRPYKEDLGTLWDELEKSINETYGEHDKHH